MRDVYTYARTYRWGLQNPDNGIMRVECGDSVADGGGGTNAALRPRFWGPVGTR